MPQYGPQLDRHLQTCRGRAFLPHRQDLPLSLGAGVCLTTYAVIGTGTSVCSAQDAGPTGKQGAFAIAPLIVSPSRAILLGQTKIGREEVAHERIIK